MGWFERLSGSDKKEGARHASVAEHIEVERYKAHHKPLKPDEALKWDGWFFTGYHLHKASDESPQWDGSLFTGYHLRKAKKDVPVEYVKVDGSGSPAKINN